MNKKLYVACWARLANSGTFEFVAENIQEAERIAREMFRPQFYEIRIYEITGEIATYGEAH